MPKGAFPGLGKGTATFCAFFYICFLLPIGKALIFVSVVVGITAAGCIASSNGPKLGRVMRQKACSPALTKALLPFKPFFSVCCSCLVETH